MILRKFIDVNKIDSIKAEFDKCDDKEKLDISTKQNQ